MPKQFKITVLADSAALPNKDPQFLKRPQKPTTEYYVIRTLRKLGHIVKIIPVENSLAAVAKQLKPDLVFNLTEEFKGDRRKDKVITSMLTKLKIPFTGTNSAGLAVCRDKILSKRILAKHKINVPNCLLFSRAKKVKVPRSVKFPMVVKPAFEDGSEGISNASVVNNITDLKKRVRFVTEKWNQPAVAEEYVKGREFYVGILGNKKPITLPVMECKFSRNAKGPCLVTYRVKWNEEYRRKWNVRFGSAKLDDRITEKISQVCKKAYKLLHLRDYGRVDLRLTQAGKIVILEVNANPDVKYGGELAEAALKAGTPYEKFIEKLILTAIERTK